MGCRKMGAKILIFAIQAIPMANWYFFSTLLHKSIFLNISLATYFASICLVFFLSPIKHPVL